MNSDALQSIISRIDALLKNKERVIVAIAGAPASGKSTISLELKAHYGKSAAIAPMDGFHLDNPILIERGLLARKGSEPTFDAIGYFRMIERIAKNDEVYAPRFSRGIESSVGSAIYINREPIIITEGNYLLLDKKPWSLAREFFDLTVFIDVSENVLKDRLYARWQQFELTESQIDEKIHHNDLINARLIIDSSVEADLRIKIT